MEHERLMYLRKDLAEGTGHGRTDPGESEFLTFGDVLAFLRRHIRLIVICEAVAVALALAHLLTAERQYTATATILIDPQQTQLVAVTGTTIAAACCIVVPIAKLGARSSGAAIFRR